MNFVYVDDEEEVGFYHRGWYDGTYMYFPSGTSGMLYAYSFDGSDLAFIDGANVPGGGVGGSFVVGDGTYLYLAAAAGGIHAYTFDGITLTKIAGRYDGTIFGASSVWYDGTYIYVTYGSDGLFVYTFNGSAFTLIDSIDDGGTALSVWGDGSFIYVANGSDGLRAYTFNGTVLTNVGQITPVPFTNNACRVVYGDGSYIYTACSGDGVYAFSFDGVDFTQLDRDLDTHDDPTPDVRDVFWDNGRIYVGRLGAGLLVYTFNGSSFTRVGTIDKADLHELTGTAEVIAVDAWGGTYVFMSDLGRGVEVWKLVSAAGQVITIRRT